MGQDGHDGTEAASRTPSAPDLDAYLRVWGDPAVEQRIADGIEAHRKSDVTVMVRDTAGEPVKGATVRLEQTGHAFGFGANGFMVGGYPEAARNRLWEERFAALFNTTTIPFYWKDFEPEPGAFRIGEDSRAIYRRPPAERVLAFARRRGLATKGHTLVWQQPEIALPPYWPADRAQQQRLIQDRIAFLAGQFGGSIGIWDVVNEVVHSARRFDSRLMPADYVAQAFEAAAAAFPPTTELVLNEATPEVWDELADTATPFYLLASGLLARGLKLDALGLQMHFFSVEELEGALAGRSRSPEQLFAALDLYGRLGRPLHVTEVTIPALASHGGADVQALMARNLYRLWFSHPAVAGITWWNLADGTALAGEDQWNGGLLEADTLAPKPAYKALDALINSEWRSRPAIRTGPDGLAAARLFHGTYRATVSCDRGTWTSAFHLPAGPARSFLLQEGDGTNPAGDA